MKNIILTAALAATFASYGKSITVINMQSSVGDAPFTYVTNTITSGLRKSVKLVAEPFDAKRMPRQDEGFIIKVVDREECPSRMICAPDDGFAVVNVHQLKTDKPTDKILERRVIKEMWRGLVYGMGAGNTQTPPCLMKPCVTLADIDRLGSCCPSPEVFNAIEATCRKRGIGGQE